MSDNSSFEDLEAWEHKLERVGRFVTSFLKNEAQAEGFHDLNIEGVDPRSNWASLDGRASELEDVLKSFQKLLVNRGINPTSGNFMGYIPGGGVPDAALGDFLAAITNRYAGVFRASPGAVEVENAVVDWFIRKLGLEKTTWGTLTSGGTSAEIVCLVAARATLPHKDWSKAVIYFSEETHHCLKRALVVTGMMAAKLSPLPTNDQFQLDPQTLQDAVRKDREEGLIPWIVVANAGTVNTGAVDPLDQLCDVAHAEGMWFHIDAAYGGGFSMIDETRDLFRAFKKADSLILDPHKGFFQPYGLGLGLVRNGDSLKKEMAYTADYLKDVEDDITPSPSDYSLELTRHFRGLRFWLTLKLHGEKEFFRVQSEKIKLARDLHEALQQIENVEVGPPPNLSIVTFRWRDRSEEEQFQGLDHLLKSGFHLSSTKLGGKTFMRACILNFRTHRSHIDDLVAAISQF